MPIKNMRKFKSKKLKEKPENIKHSKRMDFVSWRCSVDYPFLIDEDTI